MLIGPVYFVVFLLSALANRQAHVLVNRIGNEQASASFLWGMMLVVFAGLLPAMLLKLNSLVVVGFIALYVALNLWRPVLISRFDAHSEGVLSASERDSTQGGGIASLCGSIFAEKREVFREQANEPQAKSFASMSFAPLIGWAIDASRISDPTVGEFWPIGAVGAVVALAFFVKARFDTATERAHSTGTD